MLKRKLAHSKGVRMLHDRIQGGRLYKLLRDRFGFLNWWPGDTRDEILIGAVLTQNTSWKNVEKAIKNLKAADMLSIEKISHARIPQLQSMIRPSGYYRQKAQRLKGICKYITANYGTLNCFFSQDTPKLRAELLSLSGIGPETADSILLYSAGKPVFVIDAYTRRAVQRIYGEKHEMGYSDLQSLLQGHVPADLRLYKDFHAQFVELGKNYCKKKPLCGACPLRQICNYATPQIP